MRTDVDKEQDGYLRAFSVLAPCLCAFFVIGLHSYNVTSCGWDFPSRVEGFLSHWVFMAAVPAFFVLSGFRFFNNANDIISVVQKQKRRIFTVLISFLTWSTFYYLFYVIGGQFVSLHATVDRSLWGAGKAILFYEYVFPMWYML